MLIGAMVSWFMWGVVLTVNSVMTDDEFSQYTSYLFYNTHYNTHRHDRHTVLVCICKPNLVIKPFKYISRQSLTMATVVNYV